MTSIKPPRPSITAISHCIFCDISGAEHIQQQLTDETALLDSGYRVAVDSTCSNCGRSWCTTWTVMDDGNCDKVTRSQVMMEMLYRSHRRI